MGTVYSSLVGAVLGALAGILHLVGHHSTLLSPDVVAQVLLAVFLSAVGLAGGYTSRWYRRPGGFALVFAGIVGFLVVSTYFIPAAVFFIVTGLYLCVTKGKTEQTATA